MPSTELNQEYKSVLNKLSLKEKYDKLLPIFYDFFDRNIIGIKPINELLESNKTWNSLSEKKKRVLLYKVLRKYTKKTGKFTLDYRIFYP